MKSNWGRHSAYLGHHTYIHARVRKPERQRPTRRPNVVLRLPPPQITQHDALDHTPGQGRREVDIGVSHGTPEGDHGKAVDQAAAKSDGSAFDIVVVGEVESSNLGAVFELFCARRVGVAGEFGVEELKEVDGEAGGVIIHFCRRQQQVSI